MIERVGLHDAGVADGFQTLAVGYQFGKILGLLEQQSQAD